MKKFGLIVLGGIAAIVLLANLGPMIGLAISLVIMYYAVKQFTKTESTGAKIGWAIVGLIALAVTASNVPAVLGIAALYILYIVYKKWNNTEEAATDDESDDPFTNFERQWADLKRN